MLDVTFLQFAFVDLALAGRIENLLLKRGMDRQLKANLLRQLFLAAVAFRAFECLEQFLDLAVVLF